MSSAAIKSYEDLDGRLLDASDFYGHEAPKTADEHEKEQASRLKIRLLNQKFDFLTGTDEYFSKDNYEKTRKLFIKIGIKLTTADLRNVFEVGGQ